MNWNIFPHDLPRYGDQRDLVTRMFTTEGQYPVVVSKINSTWYAAVLDTGTRSVEAYVILTSRAQGRFAVKVIPETEGPTEAKAPLTLLDRLTPTDNAAALKWREVSRAYSSTLKQVFKGYRPGDVLQLASPVHFGHIKVDRVTVTTYERGGKSHRGYLAEGVGLVRLQPRYLWGAERVA